MRQAIIGEDPNLVVDLIHLNKGRPSDTFKVFFDTMEIKVDKISAADEHRYGVAHLSNFITLRDLIEQITKDCPTAIPIPRETTILFAFTPKNAYMKTARLYKSQFQLKFKVQSWQLRASHVDGHYCASQFCYIKQYAVNTREVTTFLCTNDKSKIDYGEPNHAISLGVSGKKSIVPVSTVLGALNHNVNLKGSFTLSVSLEVEIPDELDSFYRGQVTVALKGSVLQPSSPFRHATEIKELLQDHVKLVLMIYSNGGSDHRLTYHSVQLSLISVFVNLDLGMLIAARTAPEHSWANPIERLMSLLNLAYQNVANSRKFCSADIEKKAQEVHKNGEYSKIVCK